MVDLAYPHGISRDSSHREQAAGGPGRLWSGRWNDRTPSHPVKMGFSHGRIMVAVGNASMVGERLLCLNGFSKSTCQRPLAVSRHNGFSMLGNASSVWCSVRQRWPFGRRSQFRRALQKHLDIANMYIPLRNSVSVFICNNSCLYVTIYV